MGRHKPVPLAPCHRRDWSRWGRWCVCGLRWKTCPDRHTRVPTEPTGDPRHGGNSRYERRGQNWNRGRGQFQDQSQSHGRGNQPGWAAMTVAYPIVGRPGQLTVAQTWRANGGRW